MNLICGQKYECSEVSHKLNLPIGLIGLAAVHKKAISAKSIMTESILMI